jgi:predicted AAA+ superfamily ATPase
VEGIPTSFVIFTKEYGVKMIEILKEIILDDQEMANDTGVERHLKIETVQGKATVCIGVRRSGKSTFMRQIIEKLQKEGIPSTSIVHINFFDDRLHFLKEQGLSQIIDAYYQLFPEKKNKETVYFFLDEIQTIPEWELFVERLMRTEKCQVYITGSSARMLSREIATQMRGRSLSWEMYPFSFQEFLNARGIDDIPETTRLTSKMRSKVQNHFEEYWKCGGFPEVINASDSLRIKIHQEYFQTILYRDLVERHDISHPKALRDLALQLIDNTGSLYSINSLYGYLKAQEHKLQKSSITQYLEWLEDGYFLFSVRLYDASLSRSNANPKKIYCIDHSMVSSISSGILINSGHLLENLVFSTIRRKTPDIFYYRTKTGKEVDFIVLIDRAEKKLVQVCETMVEEKTRKREITALLEAMPEQKLSESIIVTRNESETIESEHGTIHVIPIWKFLLDF